jgi:hypothetical protein
MFSRRLATFVLGIWMGCCALVDFLALEGHRIVTLVLDNPNADIRDILKNAGDAAVGPLMHHAASEQTRALLSAWEGAQLVIALIMLVILILTEQRKILAIVMTAAMALLVLVQHFAVTPELSILGRSVDFLSESASFSVRSQVWTLTQLYGGLETLKLVIGGVLASYFFAMESTVKRSKTRRTRASDDLLSTPDRVA